MIWTVRINQCFNYILKLFSIRFCYVSIVNLCYFWREYKVIVLFASDISSLWHEIPMLLAAAASCQSIPPLIWNLLFMGCPTSTYDFNGLAPCRLMASRPPQQVEVIDSPRGYFFVTLSFRPINVSMLIAVHFSNIFDLCLSL